MKNYFNWKKWSAFGIGFVAAALGAGWYLKQKNPPYVLREDNKHGSLWISETVICQLLESCITYDSKIPVSAVSFQETDHVLFIEVTVPSLLQDDPMVSELVDKIQKKFLEHLGTSFPIQVSSVGDKIEA